MHFLWVFYRRLILTADTLIFVYEGRGADMFFLYLLLLLLPFGLAAGFVLLLDKMRAWS